MKTLKKSLLLLFATLTLAALFCFGASAKTVPASGSCGENVTYTYNSTTKELVISGEGAMTNYSYNGSPFYDSNIKSVVMESGVTTIGNYAFRDCDSLTSVAIPNSVTTIGSSAFYSCQSLRSVTIGNSVTTIGSSAFSGCNSLQSVTIGNSVTTIGNYAFRDCDSLQSIIIPDGVNIIGESAFRECNSLNSVTIENGVTSIGSYAFYNCDNLQNITIPDSVTAVGSRAFSDCDNLHSVTIGRGVNSIGSYTFRSCARLQSITVNENNKKYCSDDYGVLFNKKKTKLIQYPTCSTRTVYIIPDSVTTISNYAFYCARFKNVTIPDSIVSIGTYAFRSCKKLQNVTIPDNVETVSEGAFKYCTSLQSATIGSGITTINSFMFEYCTSLTNTTIPDSVTTIGPSAFSNCTSLASLTIPNSVTTIGFSAFSNCYKIKNITISDSVTTIDNYAFRYCSGLQDVTIGNKVTTIGSYVFDGCRDLKSVYYTGTQKQWQTISVGGGNSYFTKATIYYNYCGSVHKNIVDKPQQNPTCTEVGYTEGKQCSHCEKWISGHEKISATGHSFSPYKTTKKATCTSAGSKQRTCSVCMKVETATIEKLAHSYKATTTKATLTKNGIIVNVCSVCRAKKSDTTIYYPKTFALSTAKYICDGTNKTPKVTVKDANGKTLVKNTDYKVSITSKRSAVGRYTVKITFIGDYEGSKHLYYYILPGATASVKASGQTISSLKLSWSAVSGAAGYKIYRYSPSKKTYVSAGETTKTNITVSRLLEGTRYAFKVLAYGKTAAGNIYNSEKDTVISTATRTEVPELIKVAASSVKGKVYLYHSDENGETGYTVYYSTSKSSGFKKYRNYSADTDSATVNGLTSGKTYYFKIRTYIKTDSGYVYSPWSAVKSVKVK